MQRRQAASGGLGGLAVVAVMILVWVFWDRIGPPPAPPVPQTALQKCDRGSGAQGIADCTALLADADLPLAYQVHALGARAHALAHGGDPDAALQDIEAALALAPGRDLLRVMRAHIRMEQGDFAAAMAELDAVLARDPADEEALRLRAFAHMALGAPEAALRDLAPFRMKRFPDDRLQLLAGLALYRLGRDEAATAIWTPIYEDQRPRRPNLARRLLRERDLLKNGPDAFEPHVLEAVRACAAEPLCGVTDWVPSMRPNLPIWS